MQAQTRPLLDPYRTIGCFLSGPLSLVSNPIGLAAPTHTSFKIYSSSLTIKVQSPPFPHPVTAITSYNQYTYLRTFNKIVKMRYHHIVGEWEVKSSHAKKCTLLKFDEILLLGQGDRLVLVDEVSNQVLVTSLSWGIEGMVHPVTYLNKVLLWEKHHLQLVNPLSNKTLYQFQQIVAVIEQNDTFIVAVQPAPLVDIVLVALENGMLLFLNLRKAVLVFSLRQKCSPTALAFSGQSSWLATGDEQGNVILWDLEQKRILYKMEQCVAGRIDSLLFMPGLQALTVGSSQSNCIKQLRINLQDNKIMTLLRERMGNTSALEHIEIGGNNELVLSNHKETMFISFHSQCNSYLLPNILHSKLPYHLKAKHFSVELYNNRTLVNTFKIGQTPLLGKISLSNKYYIVATARKMMKLGMSYPLEWQIPDIQHILLYNEHYIYAITSLQIIVCDFNTNEIKINIPKKRIVAPVQNHFHNLMAFGSEEGTIEIWDLGKIQQGRVFNPSTNGQPLCLSFTADNRFLLSSHHNSKLVIWDIPNSQLYKTFSLEQDLIFHCFTPDNQFMVSLFRHNREANVWNNYLGKMNTSRKEESLHFQPMVKIRIGDARNFANCVQASLKISQEEVQEEDIFNSIPDAKDNVKNYCFSNISQWLPLAHYDQIRERNAPSHSSHTPSLPFFLDFKNLTKEKKKLQEQLRHETKENKRKALQQQDKHLKSTQNQIVLNCDSSEEDYIQTFQKLCKLSIAEIDYQLRVFLLTSNRDVYLLKMLQASWTQSQQPAQIKNIIMHRMITLIGIDLVQSELAPLCSQLRKTVQGHVLQLREKLNSCIVVAEHQ